MIVTLCGSTRFKSHFMEWNARLALCGHAVFNLSMFGRQSTDVGKPDDNVEITCAQKITLDLVHLTKIDASDAIFVLNVGGYVGESTAREVEWSRMKGKRVIWLEADHKRMRGEERSSATEGWLS